MIQLLRICALKIKGTPIYSAWAALPVFFEVRRDQRVRRFRNTFNQCFLKLFNAGPAAGKRGFGLTRVALRRVGPAADVPASMRMSVYAAARKAGLPLVAVALTALLSAGCGGSAVSNGVSPETKAEAKSRHVYSPAQPPAQVLAPVTTPARPQVPPKRTQDSGAADPAPAPRTPATPVSGSGQTAAERVSSALSSGQTAPASGNADECWAALIQRLQKDPSVPPESIRYFCALPPYSAAPMGVKVKELFTNAFLRKQKVDDGKPKPPPLRIYRNVVTAAALQKCRDFMETHEDALAAVGKRYPVPKEVIVALLFVETRLGNFVGKENALWSLACMAASDSPGQVREGLAGIALTEQHNEWLQAKLTDKSNWAYAELRSFLTFCHTQNLDPHVMPGSVYGAIGICQFMPSNLLPYGDDGDGDGVVNLFSVPDAIFSAAKYLTSHGWKADMSVANQRAVLKRYNNLTIYANTILALAESIRSGTLQTGPPDAPVKAAAPRVKSKKKG